MNRTGAGVERVSQEGLAGPCGAQGEKGVPIIGVDYGYLWSRAPEASDAPHDEVAGEDPPDGVRTSFASALWKVQCGSVAIWSSLSGKRGQRAESCRVGKRAASWRLLPGGLVA